MPTYEYRCPEGHDFERFYRKISDAAAELPCPECGKTAVRQLSGGAGLLFKGSGFYLTDYGKNAHRGKGASNDSAESKRGESGGDSASGGSSPTKSTEKSGEAKPSQPASSDKKPGSGGGDAASGSSKPSGGSSPKSDH